MPNNQQRRKARQKNTAFTQGHNPGQGYAPSSFGGAGWGALQSAILDGKPVFTIWDVPRMLRDPQVQFGLEMRVAPCSKGRWDVKCDRPEVKEFIDGMYHTFWRTAMPQVVSRYLAYGAGPAIFEFDIEGDTAKLVDGRGVEPGDATARVWTAGEERGKFAGFNLRNINSDHTEEFVAPPYSFWFSGQDRRGRFYDTSALAGAFQPFLFKNSRGGVLDTLALYYRKAALGNPIIRHPDGPLDPYSPTPSISNRDYARQLMERRENGSFLIFPNTFVPTGEAGKYENAWQIEFPKEQGTSANIMEGVEWCDKQILIGLGIPPEVVEAQMGGLGQGGRTIPQEAFYQMTDLIVGPLVSCFEKSQVRETVLHNFGKVKYSIESIPLGDVEKKEAQEAQSSVGPDAAAGVGAMAQPQPQPQDDQFNLQVQGGPQKPKVEEKGDPTAGGLVPYLGKYGGKGKKDQATGKVYYNLSHSAGRSFGCVLAPIVGDLRSACHEYQKTIDPKDLSEDGLEPESHITIKYGIHTGLHNPVFSAMANNGSLNFESGEIRCFSHDDGDVLYVSCNNPYQWSKWHDSLKSLPSTETFKEYTPHLTLAYLKPGRGKNYVGQEIGYSEPCSIPEVEYNTADNHCESMVVWPTADELDCFDDEKAELSWVASKVKAGSHYWLPDGEEDVAANRLYGEAAERAANVSFSGNKKTARVNSVMEHHEESWTDHDEQTLDKFNELDAKGVQMSPKSAAKFKQLNERKTLENASQNKASQPILGDPKPQTPVAPPMPVKSSATPLVKSIPVDQKKIIGRLENKVINDPKNAMTAGAAGVNFRDLNIPDSIADRFDGHGADMTGMANLLNGGIDSGRSFYSASLNSSAKATKNGGSGYGVTLSDSNPFVVVSHPDKTLKDGGIAAVIISDSYAEHMGELQKAFPGVRFVPAKDAKNTLTKVLSSPQPVKRLVPVANQPVQTRTPTSPKPPVAQPVKTPVPVASPVAQPNKQPPVANPVAKPPVLQPVKSGVPIAKPVAGQPNQLPNANSKQENYKPPIAKPVAGQYKNTPEHVAHAKDWAAKTLPTKSSEFQKIGIDPAKHGPAIQKSASDAMLRMRQEMAKNPSLTKLKYWANIGGKRVLFTISKKPAANAGGKEMLSHGAAFVEDWDLSIAA